MFINIYMKIFLYGKKFFIKVIYIVYDILKLKKEKRV